jgi:putative ABC transport system ATP-binding protein
MTERPMIEVVGVTKRYGAGQLAATVIDALDLSVPRGEFLSIMGPSGSGKSTLLNLIAGLDAPDSGHVALNGTELGGLSDRQLTRLRLRMIGFIFQAFNLLPALTVERNVAWPLQFSGLSRSEARERAAEALEQVGVGHCARRHPAELSGGEQQRVAIARALATRPAILLADEPTGNLDSQTGQHILDLLRSLSRAARATVIMVTHSVFAATYGDRTIELHDGRIRRDVRTPSPGHGLTALAGIER